MSRLVRRVLSSSGKGKWTAGQLRHNACTGDWVCYATDRTSRPMQTQQLRVTQKTSEGVPHDPNCPFCLGNEALTGASLLEMGGGVDRDSQFNPWSLRIVKNKYPALSMPPDDDRTQVVIDPSALQQKNDLVLDNFADAIGSHEVVIETPHHNVVLALDDVERVERLVRAWRDRGRQLIGGDWEGGGEDGSARARSPRSQMWRHLLYFKNQGSGGGASIMHPHSQLVALPIVPENVERAQDYALRWYNEHGVGVWRAMVEEELELQATSPESHRIVDSNDDFIALVPFAALSPYSMWILPRFDAAHYEATSDEHLSSFASLLHRCLRRIHFGLGEPDFNLIIRSAPVANRGRQRAYNASTFYRWHASLFPRMGAGAMAGFEFASGIFSNSHIPEADARSLREVDVDRAD